MLTRPDPTRQNPAKSWPDSTRPDPTRPAGPSDPWTTLLSIYLAPISYIRPLLEYASPIWSPSGTLSQWFNWIGAKSIHQASPRATKFFLQRTTKLKMQSLEHRRLLGDLVVCFNIIHGLSALQFNDFFKFSNTSRTRGHNLRLETTLIKNNTRWNFFAHRIIKLWNALPATIVNSHSSQFFKSQISNLDLSLYLKYPCIPHNS